MTRSTRDVTPSARPRSLRALGTWSIMLLVCAGVACGKKGPPLAPFVRVPAAVATIAPQRVGNDVYVSFTVPDTNVDGQKPADIGAVEVYAVTSDRPPATEEQREMATLVATLPVRPILSGPPGSCQRFRAAAVAAAARRRSRNSGRDCRTADRRRPRASGDAG